MKLVNCLVVGMLALAVGCTSQRLVAVWSTDSSDDNKTDDSPFRTYPDSDQDSDGVTPHGGDCLDVGLDAHLVNPGAIEDLGSSGLGDGIDNDCDGQIDEDELAQCKCAPTVGITSAAFDCATEIGCFPQFMLAPGEVTNPTDDPLRKEHYGDFTHFLYPEVLNQPEVLGWAFEAMSQYGEVTNDLAPRQGDSYAVLATGPVHATRRTVFLPNQATDNIDDPFGEGTMTDVVEYTVKLKAPSNAQGIEFDYVFFSTEYDFFIGTGFNDRFYVILNGPDTTNGEQKVINFTQCRDQAENGYYDFIDAKKCAAHPFHHCCYIAINSALSECCFYPQYNKALNDIDGKLVPCPNGYGTVDISGTGFECTGYNPGNTHLSGSTTGWLRTSWPIEPNEEFTLTFRIQDSNEFGNDSAVIIDNFRWQARPVTPVTKPIVY